MPRGCSSLTLREGFSKTHQSSLNLKGGFFRIPPSPFPKGAPPRFFSKTYPSFLTVKEGSTSSPKPPPPQKEGDVTAPTRSSNRYAIRLADHQRSAPDFLCGMNRMGMGLLMELHNICHQRSSPRGGQDCTGRAWHLARP